MSYRIDPDDVLLNVRPWWVLEYKLDPVLKTFYGVWVDVEAFVVEYQMLMVEWHEAWQFHAMLPCPGVRQAGTYDHSWKPRKCGVCQRHYGDEFYLKHITDAIVKTEIV